MDTAWLLGKLIRGEEQQLKNTLMEIVSQGKFGHNLKVSK